MSSPPYIVLLGDVGSGKSTLVEKLTGEHSRSSAANQSETRSEEHTSELQSHVRISYAVFCLKKKKKKKQKNKKKKKKKKKKQEN